MHYYSTTFRQDALSQVAYFRYMRDLAREKVKVAQEQIEQKNPGHLTARFNKVFYQGNAIAWHLAAHELYHLYRKNS